MAAKADNGRLYTSTDLSSTFVNCIVQQADGYVWIGTANGLNRFNGYQFRHYRHNENDAATIPDKNVTALFVDGNGTLWAGTAKGLALYDEDNDNFINVRLNADGKEEPRVTAIAQTRDGRMLVGTSGMGIFELDKGNGIHIRKRHYKGNSEDYCLCLGVDGRGRVWKGDNAGRISCYDANGKRLLALNPKYGIPLSIINNHGDIFVAFKNGIAVVSSQLKVKGRMASGFNVSTAYVAKGCGLLLGTAHGLIKVSPDYKAFEPVDVDYKGIDFASANITKVFQDRQGNLWLQCDGRGLLFLSHGQGGFANWKFSDQGVTTGSGIASIAKASDGGVWAAMHGTGIYHFSPQGRIDRRLATPDGLTLIHRDRKGNMWVGAGKSLYTFDEQAGRLSRYKSFDCDFLQTMASNGKEDIFVSAFGRGMAALAAGKTVYYNMFQQRSSPQGSVCNDWIFSMLTDSRGLLWMGTSSGVSCYNPASGSFRPFGWNSILDGHMCMSLAETKGGDILVGTVKGLFVLDRRKGKARIFPNSEVLNDKDIFSIITEGDGDVWCSTTEGIWHYRRKYGDWIGHINDNGLQEHEFIDNGGITLDDGRIAFATNNSLVVFSPRNIESGQGSIMSPELTGAYVGGQPKSLHNLSFSYQDNTFTLEFSNFDFGDAANITLEYSLDNDGWSQVRRGENSITFIHLQPGSYKLRVRVAENGRYSPIRTFKFSVRPPWYRSVHAYLIYIVILLLLVGYVWWRYDNRQRQRLAMARLQATIDDLLAKNRQMEKRRADEVEKYKGQVEQPDITDNDGALMERIMKSVNKNIDNSDYDVETMAADAGLSRSQLHRKMKELTNLSPAVFLRTIRLEQAARLLHERNTNVSQVAYAVGFNSLNSFSKAFKQHFGKSPTEYAGKA